MPGPDDIRSFEPPQDDVDQEFEQELNSLPQGEQGGPLDPSSPIEVSQILQSMENAASLPWEESSRSYQILSSLARNVIPNIVQSYASGLSPQEKEKLIGTVKEDLFAITTKLGKLWEDAGTLDKEFSLPGRPYGPVASLVDIIKLAADEDDEEEYEKELEEDEELKDEEEDEELKDEEEDEESDDEEDEEDDLSEYERELQDEEDEEKTTRRKNRKKSPSSYHRPNLTPSRP